MKLTLAEALAADELELGNSGWFRIDQERIGLLPSNEVDYIGFRVAMIPEPSTALLLAVGLAGLAAAWVAVAPIGTDPAFWVMIGGTATALGRPVTVAGRQTRQPDWCGACIHSCRVTTFCTRLRLACGQRTGQRVGLAELSRPYKSCAPGRWFG